jgi:hypothetical protein
MREQEVRELYEAYMQVHQPQEEVEQLDENVQDVVKGALEKGANFMKTNPVGKAVSKIIAPVGGGRKTPTATSGGYRKEEIDLFDTILEHLIAEGFADTNEAALAIMANMSEEWRHSIVEGKSDRPLGYMHPFARGVKQPKGKKSEEEYGQDTEGNITGKYKVKGA